MDGRKRRFLKTLMSLRRHTPPSSITLVWMDGETDKRICVFKRKFKLEWTFENAGVDANVFMRFQDNENRGFRKRVGEDEA